MNSIQITITANHEQQEVLISELEELGAEGFEQTDDQLIAYFSEINFPSYEVNTLLHDYAFETLTLEEQNWNAVWESNFNPVIVDDFCAIRAEFHDPIPGVEYEIIITPKMSFGTGHHATTYMMIRMMRDLDFENKTVFDFGTGTGILAILAEKLGAKQIDAIDVDEWSITNATENAQRNQCVRIELKQSTQLPQKQFDLILANINRNVILQYMDGLEAMMKNGNQILFSGLMTTDEIEIKNACAERGLQFIKGTERNNWISLLFVKGL